MSDFKYVRRRHDYLPLDATEEAKHKLSFHDFQETGQRQFLMSDADLEAMMSRQLSCYPKSGIDTMLAIGQQVHVDTEAAIRDIYATMRQLGQCDTRDVISDWMLDKEASNLGIARKPTVDFITSVGFKVRPHMEVVRMSNIGTIGHVYLPMTLVAMAVRSILGIKNAEIPFSQS